MTMQTQREMCMRRGKYGGTSISSYDRQCRKHGDTKVLARILILCVGNMNMMGGWTWMAWNKVCEQAQLQSITNARVQGWAVATEQLLFTDIAPDPDARAPILLVPLSSWVMPRQLLSLSVLIYTIKIVLLRRIIVKTWKGNSWDSPWPTVSNHRRLASLWVGSILKEFDFRWLALDEDVDVLTNSKTEFCTWHSKWLLMLLVGMGEPACPHWEQGERWPGAHGAIPTSCWVDLCWLL